MPPPADTRARAYCRGVTLLELLVVLFILALLLTQAAGSWSGLLRSSRADATIYQLQRLIYRARSQAISSGDIVSLCAYSPGGCGNNYEQGLMLFSDRNNNGLVDDDDRLLEVMYLELHGGELLWRASGGRNYLRYSPNGAARQFGRFHLCPVDADLRYARSLVINRQGRVRVYRDRDGDGIVEDTSGAIPLCEN